MKSVRWLGAFGKGSSLLKSLHYEVARDSNGEVAAELLRDGKSQIRHARVGLLVSQKAVIRRFDCDVWSRPVGTKSVRLKANRTKAFSEHAECFCRPEYTGVVVKNYAGMKKDIKKGILWFAKKNNLPVYELTGGELKKK